MDQYSVLLPTLKGGWLLETCAGVQTHVNECSPERNLFADIIYLYQEVLADSIRNAAKFHINLTPVSPVEWYGNCAFAALIGNVNSWECFKRKISLSSAQARKQWLTENQENVKRFAGDTIFNFDITWEDLKHSTEYNSEAADFFLLAAATSLKRNIVIFNTNHELLTTPLR